MKPTKVLALTAAFMLTVACLPVGGCAADGGSEGDAGAGGAGEPYRIGAVLSLTGTYAGLGIPEQRAIDLEVERINAAGGVNGRELVVVYEDDATDAAKAQAAAVRLIDEEGVLAIIGASGTGQTMAMRSDAERARVPIVSMAGGSVITADFSEWVFQTPWPNRIVIPFVLEEMAAAGHTTIGLISDTGGYGVDGRDIVLATAADAGVTIVADETFNAGDTDMTSQLTKIRAAEPDAVLIWAAGKEAAIIARNARQLNMEQPLYGGSGIARQEFIDGAGEAAEGVRLGTGKILVPEAFGEGTEAYAVATDFIERYEAAYGTPPDIFAGHAYDAIGLIADALERLGSGDVTSEQVRDALEQTSGWVGIDGTFTYSATDHNGLTRDEMVMYVIEDGTWRLDR
ncbi:ABC transporter substrate-binding protein [Anaerosoma tenue]|uniref:ABC transporter substrate-binding protein n=1 Tax=Anaerosoma tenue TaxID=2933588 RepID=UPI002260FE7D|nr:ABC transporter substrate-binding protein [Anaerosoma tenue]MCK8114275.1 ABC transporter substrate-binding protein [Anaerosoma tenue]